MKKTNILKDKDLDLVNKIKQDNCNESFEKLSGSYDNFYFSIARRYSQTLIKMGMSKEEIKTEKDFILYKAIQSFDAKQKTKFSTWFCNCARYHFLNYINSNKKYVLNEGFGVDVHLNKDILCTTDKNTDMYDYLSSLLSSFKDSRINEVYRLRYFSNTSKPITWNKIAKKLNISTQTAINLHEKARLFLQNKILSKNSFDLI
jgi:DNA-directed RNA polymerase specialized sigma subunit